MNAGQIDYTPTPGFEGVDTFTYSVTEIDWRGANSLGVVKPRDFDGYGPYLETTNYSDVVLGFKYGGGLRLRVGGGHKPVFIGPTLRLIPLR